ncbi:MAG: hypothetical protein H7Y33_01795 [Cytophagales bacterium]|nr:hypothetical protein [Rhizobacter sp.]
MRPVLPVALLGLMISVAACGGSDSAGPAIVPAPAPSSPPPASPPASVPPVVPARVLFGARDDVDLSVDGRIFEVDLAQNYNPWVAPAGNGGLVARLDSGGYNAAPGVELRGPTTFVGGSQNVQYTSILGGSEASGNHAVGHRVSIARRYSSVAARGCLHRMPASA